MSICKCHEKVKKGDTKMETISIQFSGEEMDKILEYQKYCGAETVQEAILDAITAVRD